MASSESTGGGLGLRFSPDDRVRRAQTDAQHRLVLVVGAVAAVDLGGSRDRDPAGRGPNRFGGEVMGTNFYLHRKTTPCETCGKPDIDDDRIHIGKSSMGWVWLWRGYREGQEPTGRALTSTQEWYEFLAEQIGEGGEIRDEYGHPHDLASLIAKVVRKRDGQYRNSDCGVYSTNRTGPDDINFREFS